jgi:cytoskeletal protein RodZ
MLDKLADELKEARKKTGLSLLQVSAKSKIDLKFLEAMEKGNFSFLPEIYVKAFIKDYANIVDLNPDMMLKKYDAFKMGRNYEPPEPVLAPPDDVKTIPAPQTFGEKKSKKDTCTGCSSADL